MSTSASPRERREFSAQCSFASANVRMWTSALPAKLSFMIVLSGYYEF